MSEIVKKVDLRYLDYSPNENPLLQVGSIPVRKKRVGSRVGKSLIDAETGEIMGAAVIHQVEEKDLEEFVKVFAAGVAATYSLTRTGQRVFQAILKVYEDTPMVKGYADSIYLAWFDDGLCGHSLDMSEASFRRGLRELLAKDFLSPKLPNQYWVNPALFFKGDRVLFVKEYRRKAEKKQVENSGKGKLING